MDKNFLAAVERLRELAEKADRLECTPYVIGTGDEAAYIEAAHPALILELARELRRLEKKLNDKKAHIGTQAKKIKIQAQNMERLRAAYQRLEKEADWLAIWCADACAQRHGNCDGCAFNEQCICPIENDEILANKPDMWREAARKAVKDETNV